MGSDRADNSPITPATILAQISPTLSFVCFQGESAVLLFQNNEMFKTAKYGSDEQKTLKFVSGLE